MTEENLSILLVDDDDTFRERLSHAFQDRNWTVFTAKNAQEGIVLAQKNSPEFVLLDLKMPGKSGLELLKEVMAVDPQTKVVMLTGYGSIATAIEAMKLGATNYLTKPVDVEEILKAFGDQGPYVQKKTNSPSLAAVEWEHIQRVLSDCDGNVSQAARRLNIHRRSLQRKLQKNPPKK